MPHYKSEQGSFINRMRETGIGVIGSVPWGTHFCQFYKTKQDLIDTLVPYFKAGLEDNEFCMWVTSDPLSSEEAKDALRAALPDLDRYLNSGQMEIIPYTEWYLSGGEFDCARVLEGWVRKLNEALEKGFVGLRLSGNTFWLEETHWDDFTSYEAAINAVIGNYSMIAMCTYSLDKCGASEIADVLTNHEFALMKRHGEWSIIESSEISQSKRALAEAMKQLEATNEQLRQEMQSRENIERALRDSEAQLKTIIDNVTEGLVVADLDGYLFHWNRAALEMHGFNTVEECQRMLPEFADTFELSSLDGRVLPVDEWPLARVLRGEDLCDMAINVRRLDTNRERVLNYGGTLVHDADDKPRLAVVTISDITERKQAEKALRESREDLNRAQAVAQTGSWRLDVHRNELLWSDENHRIFGVPKGIPQTYDTFLDIVHPEDREFVHTKWTAALRGEPYDIEHRIIVDGRVKWVRERAELEFNENGVLLGGFGTTQDITELKVAEQQREELLRREQHIARTLQQALVPPSVPNDIYGYAFAATYRPALREAEIGGDFYDVFDLGDGRICIIIGDVAGKGLRAALRVAAARYAIRSHAFVELRPSLILAHANRSLCCGGEEEHDMLTALLAIIDTREGVVAFANAGHEPPLLCSNGTTEELVATGFPLGIMPDVNYSENTCRLKLGDMLVMVTDGITEARASDRELFSMWRVADYVRDNGESPIQQMVDGLLQTATSYAGGELQDDAAIVIVKHTCKPTKNIHSNHKETYNCSV